MLKILKELNELLTNGLRYNYKNRKRELNLTFLSYKSPIESAFITSKKSWWYVISDHHWRCSTEFKFIRNLDEIHHRPSFITVSLSHRCLFKYQSITNFILDCKVVKLLTFSHCLRIPQMVFKTFRKKTKNKRSLTSP